MLGDDFRRRLLDVLSQPTAPFREGRVHRVIRAAVKASPRLRERIDAHGNVEVVYGPGRPGLVYACHTDHPALRANGDGTATIVGGIRPEVLEGVRLTTFDGTPAATAGTIVRRDAPRAAVRLRGGGALRRNTPLLLDLPAVKIDAKRIRARAVDDLVAVAACLAMFDRLEAARWDGTVGVLFTRAEEVGFAGAIGWTKTTRLPRSTTIVNLEMSNARPHTPQGGGPILRVGDRITTFLQEPSTELEAAAAELKEKDEHFRYQRALMDGGACEATVYAFAGFRASALCLPLKNYHNHAPRGGVGLEYVHRDDAENLVRWMTAFTRRFGALQPRRATEKRIDALWKRNRARLARSAAEGWGGEGGGS
jgi:endoglucanase